MRDYTATSTTFVHDLFEALQKSRFGHSRKESFKRVNGVYVNHSIAREFYWFLAGVDASASIPHPLGQLKPDIEI